MRRYVVDVSRRHVVGSLPVAAVGQQFDVLGRFFDEERRFFDVFGLVGLFVEVVCSTHLPSAGVDMVAHGTL